jgi:hypothetical protein
MIQNPIFLNRGVEHNKSIPKLRQSLTRHPSPLVSLLVDILSALEFSENFESGEIRLGNYEQERF